MVAKTEFSYRITESDMTLTPAAQSKIVELLSETDSDISAIRVFVSGGGCSGMTYGMTYSEKAEQYDSVIDGQGYRLYVDPVALNYLQGCEIDFRSDGQSPSFVFNNVFQSVGGSGTCGGCGGGSF